MNNLKLSSYVSGMVTVLLALSATLVFAGPMTPEHAAKRRNYDKQKAQQVTHEKRKVAVDGLKAERIKIYEAKQADLKANHGNGK
jgi:hypothetical protein